MTAKDPKVGDWVWLLITPNGERLNYKRVFVEKVYPSKRTADVIRVFEEPPTRAKNMPWACLDSDHDAAVIDD